MINEQYRIGTRTIHRTQLGNTAHTTRIPLQARRVRYQKRGSEKPNYITPALRTLAEKILEKKGEGKKTKNFTVTSIHEMQKLNSRNCAHFNEET